MCRRTENLRKDNFFNFIFDFGYPKSRISATELFNLRKIAVRVGGHGGTWCDFEWKYRNCEKVHHADLVAQNAKCRLLHSHLGFTLQLGSINDKPLHSVLFLMYISENKKYIKTQQYFLYFDVKYKPPASSTFSKCSDENQGIVIFSWSYMQKRMPFSLLSKPHLKLNTKKQPQIFKLWKKKKLTFFIQFI